MGILDGLNPEKRAKAESEMKIINQAIEYRKDGDYEGALIILRELPNDSVYIKKVKHEINITEKKMEKVSGDNNNMPNSETNQPEPVERKKGDKVLKVKLKRKFNYRRRNYNSGASLPLDMEKDKREVRRLLQMFGNILEISDVTEKEADKE